MFVKAMINGGMSALSRANWNRNNRHSEKSAARCEQDALDNIARKMAPINLRTRESIEELQQHNDAPTAVVTESKPQTAFFSSDMLERMLYNDEMFDGEVMFDELTSRGRKSDKAVRQQSKQKRKQMRRQAKLQQKADAQKLNFVSYGAMKYILHDQQLQSMADQIRIIKAKRQVLGIGAKSNHYMKRHRIDLAKIELTPEEKMHAGIFSEAELVCA